MPLRSTKLCTGQDVWLVMPPNCQFSLFALPGHTPGHSGYIIEGSGKKLFLWGRYCAFPVDLPLARETRKQTFERVIADGLEVGGGHLLAPGFARVERASTVYRIVPSAG
jgi:glyoxylase-like metal-dependent hydrolase (beta-lactamase superfamily II)